MIGSGAAGGVMAKELSVAGFSVVVLEQGSAGAYGHEHDYNKDELLNMYPPTPDDYLMSNPNTQPNTFRRNVNEKAVKGSHSYGCVLGGGTVTYGASSWRHLPYEFNEATHVGGVAGSGLADWPISYDEIEPYYTKAEWELGISGLRVDTPFMAPMTKPYPVKPLAMKASGAVFKAVSQKMNLTMVPNVAAIITEPYQGRSGCVSLRHVPRLRLPGEGAVKFGRHDDSHRRKDRQVRNSHARLRSRDFGERRGACDRRGLFRCAEARDFPEGEGRGIERERHGDAPPAAAFKVCPLP